MARRPGQCGYTKISTAAAHGNPSIHSGMGARQSSKLRMWRSTVVVTCPPRSRLAFAQPYPPSSIRLVGMQCALRSPCIQILRLS